ncbi:MAG: sugar phosphate nucleotidyltransferase [Bacteroidetes bacterium]|nr:sugar phosphate nucleotidyltransferase [Bacteroidota bacterium]
MKPTLLILAAGIGSRYGSLKQLDRIGPSGETIIDYSIYDAIRAGFGKVVFVIKENIEKEFREFFDQKFDGRIEVDYAFQEIGKVPEGLRYSAERQKPWGTGHAILMAAGKINEPFAVINADDFYGRGSYQSLADYYRDWTPAKENDYCMIGYELGKTLSEHGSVSRGVCRADGCGLLLEVTERTKIARDARGIAYLDEAGNSFYLDARTTVSMNFWGFTPSLFQHLEKGFLEFISLNADSPKAEFYIPGVINDLLKRKAASVRILPGSDQWFGMTYREDRDLVIARIGELVKAGIYPESLWK